MTLTQKVAGSAVFAFAICGVLLSVRADFPPAQPGLSRFAEASRHACLDMNGNAVRMAVGHVPFAANCDARPDASTLPQIARDRVEQGGSRLGPTVRTPHIANANTALPATSGSGSSSQTPAVQVSGRFALS